jgi:Spherulation-specific family 4
MARLGRSRPARAYITKTTEAFYLGVTSPKPAPLAVQAVFPVPAAGVSPAQGVLAVAAPAFPSPGRAVTAQPGTLNASAAFTAPTVSVPVTPSALTATATFPAVFPLINAAVIAGLTADLPPPAVKVTVPAYAFEGAFATFSAPTISGSGSADVHPPVLALTGAAASPGTVILQTLAVPSYIYPTGETGSGAWQTMEAAAPQVGIVLINPDSGPGSSSDPNYAAETTYMQAAGVKVLGYVITNYAATSLSSVESQIDDYYTWYGVDGIFLDDATTAAGADQEYFASLYSYIKAKPGGRSNTVAINPGTPPDVSYMSCCDICCDCETDLGSYRVRVPASWESGYPANRFWHIIYAAGWSGNGTAQMYEVLNLSRTYNAGYVFITNAYEPNPYDVIPSNPYWSELIAQLATPTGINTPAPAVEDGFDQASGVLSSQWTPTGTVSIASYQLTVLAQYSYGNYCNSTAEFNFTGRTASVSAPIVPTTASGEQWMQVAADGSDYLSIGKSGSSMVFRVVVGGVNLGDVTVTYNATNHLYWGISLSTGGTATWQTSPDGNTWTVQRVLSSGLPALSSAYLSLLAGHYSSGDSDQTVAYDNVIVSAPFTAITLPPPAVTSAATPGALSTPAAAVSAAGVSVTASPSPATGQFNASTPKVTATILAAAQISAAYVSAPVVTLTVGAASLSPPLTGAATLPPPAVQGGNANPAPAPLSVLASLLPPAVGGLIPIPVTPNWMSNGEYIHLLYESYPAVADFYFDTPNAFSIGNTNDSNPVEDGFSSTPVLRYTAYAAFQSDIANGAISSFYGWVLYDLEDWGSSPPAQAPAQAEIDDPWEYMGYFTTLAHENGYQVILSPAQDLGNDTTSANPKESGETNSEWFIRTNVAGSAAGTGADIVELQDQNNTATLSTFDTFYFNALSQIQEASTTCQVWCGLSTSYGTVTQMLAAYESLLGWCNGIWMNATDSTIATMEEFLASIPVSPPPLATGAQSPAPAVTVTAVPLVSHAIASLPAPTVSTPAGNANATPAAQHSNVNLGAAALTVTATPAALVCYAQLNCFYEIQDEAYNVLLDELSVPLLEEQAGYDLATADVVTVTVTFLPPLNAAATIPAPILSATVVTPLALAATANFPVPRIPASVTSLDASATLGTPTPQLQPAVTALHVSATLQTASPVINTPALTGFTATLSPPAVTLSAVPASLAATATLPAPAVPAPVPLAAAATFPAATVLTTTTVQPAAFSAGAGFPVPACAVTAFPGPAGMVSGLPAPAITAQGSVALVPTPFYGAATFPVPAPITVSVPPAPLALTVTPGTPTVSVNSTTVSPSPAAGTPFVPIVTVTVTERPGTLSATATAAPPVIREVAVPVPCGCAASVPVPTVAGGILPYAFGTNASFGIPAVTVGAAPGSLDASATAGTPSVSSSGSIVPQPLQATATITPPAGVFIYPLTLQVAASVPSPVITVAATPFALRMACTILSIPIEPVPLGVSAVFPAASLGISAPTGFGPWCFTTTEQDANQFGGGWTHGNGYAGAWVDVNLYGGTENDANPYLGLGIFGYGGSADAGNYNGTADCGCFITMEAVNITIGEFNDETIDLAITNSGSPFNLNSPQYGLQVLLKTAAGVLDDDPSTVILTSDGENPAITIAAGGNGLATLVIPHAVLQSTVFTFWRCDVTTPSGLQATAMYGVVTVKQL